MTAIEVENIIENTVLYLLAFVAIRALWQAGSALSAYAKWRAER